MTIRYKFFDKDKDNGQFALDLSTESDGTKKLIALAIILVLYNNSTILIDEFDDSFHVELSKAMIEVFNSNKQNNQFILISHELALMDSGFNNYNEKIGVKMVETKKEIAKKQLKKLINKYNLNREAILDKENNYNEANTRREYIDPFLEILGWDLQNKSGKSLSESDVIVENYLGNNRSNRADYSLRRNGSIFYTIEAEKPSKDIHKDLEPASQVLRYGWNANNNIGILTNFEFLQFFQTYTKPSDKVIKPWKDIRYDQYLNQFDLIWDILSCDSVYNETADTRISEITPETATKHKLDQHFLNELDSWRILIGQDLVNNDYKKYSNSIGEFKVLNDDVQVFLNQIIFLRFAEDNQLEKANENNELEYVFSNYETSPDDFDKRLKELDSRYNSRIFENNSIAKKLQPSTVKKIVKSLYYPTSVYDFSIIDLGILGKIYEQFLQKVLYVKDNKKVILEPTRQAKINSVVSTPIELTRVITHHALSNVLEKITNIDDLFKLKIGDIAAGSGIFLVAVYDELENKILELQGVTSLNHNTIINLELKKRIISDILYGSDIDPHAIQVTKFSLALRLLKNENPSRFQGQTPIIPAMAKNIVSENSLITTTDIANILTKDQKFASVLPLEINEINPANKVERDFNVILGNPPYLETRKMKSGSTIEFAIYKEKYKSAKKQFDKYFLFIEEMIYRLTESGSGTFIIQNKFFSIDTARELRSYLLNNGYLDSIIDFKDKQLFKGKNTYVAIVTFSKNKNKSVKYAIANSISEASNPSFKEYQYSDIGSKDSNWIFEDNDAFRLYNSMSNYPRLSEIIEYRNGIQTSRNDVYMINVSTIISNDDKYISFKKASKIWKIEKKILKPLFKNKKKKGTYYTQPEIDTWVIFPYDSKGKLISNNIMKQEYPLCWKYLIDNKDKLLPKALGGKRDTGADTGENEWYKYGRTQGLISWERPKLIVGVLSKGPSTAYDNKHMLLASGGTAGYVPIYQKNDEYALEYIEAWINYPLTDEMFKLQTTRFQNGYWTHGTNVMKKIPFLTIDKNDYSQFNLYTQIVEITKQINETKSEKVKEVLILTVNKLIDNLIQIKDIM